MYWLCAFPHIFAGMLVIGAITVNVRDPSATHGGPRAPTLKKRCAEVTWLNVLSRLVFRFVACVILGAHKDS